MAHFDPVFLAAILAVLAVTHWLGAVTAFGSTLLAFPVLTWFMGIHDVRAALLLIGTVQSYQVFAYVRRDVNWQLLGRMVFFAGLGLPVGIHAMRYLREAPLLVFLGCVLVASGAAGAWRGDCGPPARRPRALLDGLLVVGGVMHGAFVCGAAATVIYAQHVTPEKGAFRGTLTAFWTSVNTILVIHLFWSGESLAPTIPVLAAGIPVVLLVSWLGNRAASRLSQRRFARLVGWLLVLAGIVTFGRAFG